MNAPGVRTISMRNLMFFALALTLSGADGGSPVHTIPFTVHGNGVYLSVSVNGSRPMQFLLDTAAGTHVINWRRAEELGLRLDVQATASGAGNGSTRAAILRDLKLTIGSLELPAPITAAVNLDAVSERKGIELDGLIGADLLKRYVVDIDTGAAVMKLYDYLTWSYMGPGEMVPLRVDGRGQPYVKLDLLIGEGAPVTGEYLIDSAAAEATLALTAPFAKKYDVLGTMWRSDSMLVSDELFGVGGSSKMWTGRVTEVRLGKTVFLNPTIDLTEATGGTFARADLAGTIGGELLHRFRVFFDCPHGRMYLEPTARLKLPFEGDMSGIRWLATGEGGKQLRVRTALPGSPASKAGVQAGDTLVSIDGRAGNTLDKWALRKLLETPGKKVKLELDRGGKRITVELLLKRLV